MKGIKQESESTALNGLCLWRECVKPFLAQVLKQGEQRDVISLAEGPRWREVHG